jgi:hypothetical protein
VKAKAKYKLISILSIIIFILIECERCPKCFTMPETIRLRYVSKIDSSDLIAKGFYKIDSIKIYYEENKLLNYIDFQIMPNIDSSKFMLSSLELSLKSSQGIKYFYIKLNEYDFDTLFLDVEKKSGDCCSYYTKNMFKYNGKEIQMNKPEFDYFIKK